MRLSAKEILAIIFGTLVLVLCFKATASNGNTGRIYYGASGKALYVVTGRGDVIAADGRYRGRIDARGSYIARDGTYRGRVINYRQRTRLGSAHREERAKVGYSVRPEGIYVEESDHEQQDQ